MLPGPRYAKPKTRVAAPCRVETPGGNEAKFADSRDGNSNGLHEGWRSMLDRQIREARLQRLAIIHRKFSVRRSFQDLFMHGAAAIQLELQNERRMNHRRRGCKILYRVRARSERVKSAVAFVRWNGVATTLRERAKREAAEREAMALREWNGILSAGSVERGVSPPRKAA